MSLCTAVSGSVSLAVVFAGLDLLCLEPGFLSFWSPVFGALMASKSNSCANCRLTATFVLTWGLNAQSPAGTQKQVSINLIWFTSSVSW